MKALFLLTIRNLKQNRKRTIVTILGVILSTILLVTIGFFFATHRENSIQEIYRTIGDFHLKIEDVPYSVKTTLEQESGIKSLDYELLLGEADYTKYLDQTSLNSYSIMVRGYNRSNPEITVKEGRLPNNDREVILPMDLKGTLTVTIGDTMDLLGEKTIVGFYSEALRSNYKYAPNQYGGNLSAYIDIEPTPSTDAIFYLKFSKIHHILKKIEQLGEKLGYASEMVEEGSSYVREFEHFTINRPLFSLYGEIDDAVTHSVYFLGLFLTLTVLSLFCLFVIYNSFAISVRERKKQLGIYASLGATPKQLFFSVLLEALVISLIAIPLGILISVAGVQGILWLFNQLLKGILPFQLTFAFDALSFFLPIGFIFFTVLFSAFFPAMRAYEITPMDAIRESTDVKVNKRSLKVNRVLSRLFGVEGTIALKNRKRNKKKYRVTTLSLVISFVLFVTFSSIYELVMKNIDWSLNEEDSIELSIGGKEEDAYLADLKKSDLDELQVYKVTYAAHTPFTEELTEAYSKYNSSTTISMVHFFQLEKKEYEAFVKQVGAHSGEAIFINQFYDQTTKQWIPIFEKFPEWTFCNFETIIEELSNGFQNPVSFLGKECTTFSSVRVTNLVPNSLKNGLLLPSFVVSKEVFESLPFLQDKEIPYRITIQTKKPDQLDQVIQKMEGSYQLSDYYYMNHGLMVLEQKRTLFAIRLALYLFLGFITMIGVTSVLNTISTSIALQRREFAMLRSVGLSPHGFTKMMTLESLFFGFKTLLYGIPLSLLIIYILKELMGLQNLGKLEEDRMLFSFPTEYLIIAMVAVFLIVFFTTMYSVRKIKKENIMDAINEVI